MSNPDYHIPQWTIADRFRKARTDAGLSQQQLADRIQISKKSIGNYETGATTHMRRNVVNQWALATGVPVAWLMFGTVSDADKGGDQPNGQSGWTHKFEGELAEVLNIREAPPILPQRKPKRTRSNKAG